MASRSCISCKQQLWLASLCTSATSTYTDHGARVAQAAITHYIGGGVPARAAAAIACHGWQRHLPQDVIEGLLARLSGAGLHDAAAALLEHLRRPHDALNAYRKCAVHQSHSARHIYCMVCSHMCDFVAVWTSGLYSSCSRCENDLCDNGALAAFGFLQLT